MERCESCGNAYENTFCVVMDGKSHTFDSFECAINVLAPRCAACGTRIVGHGVQAGETLYCCGNCARNQGVTEVRDHA
jgi:hypothetical protein